MPETLHSLGSALQVLFYAIGTPVMVFWLFWHRREVAKDRGFATQTEVKEVEVKITNRIDAEVKICRERDAARKMEQERAQKEQERIQAEITKLWDHSFADAQRINATLREMTKDISKK